MSVIMPSHIISAADALSSEVRQTYFNLSTFQSEERFDLIENGHKNSAAITTWTPQSYNHTQNNHTNKYI